MGKLEKLELKLDEAILKEQQIFGIENISSIIRYLSKVYKRGKKFAEDGKYSFWEKLSTLTVLGEASKFVGKGEALKQEFRDLDEDEILKLTAVVFDELGFKHDEALEFIVDVLSVIGQMGYINNRYKVA